MINEINRKDDRKLHKLKEIKIPKSAVRAHESSIEGDKLYTSSSNASTTSDNIIPSKPSYIPTVRESTGIRNLRNRGLQKQKKTSRNSSQAKSSNSSSSSHLVEIQRQSKIVSDDNDSSWAMMLLDTSMIRKLRKALRKHYRDGMDMQQFLSVVLGYVTISHNQTITEMTIAEKIYTLFKRIDVYSSGIITWEMLASHVLGFSGTQEKSSDKVRQYRRAPRNPIPNSSLLDHMYYFKDVDIWLISDTNGKLMFASGAQNIVLRTHAPTSSNSTLLDAIYIPSLRYIVTSSHDQTICFYDTVEFEKRQQLPMPSGAQSALAWHESASKLFSASVTGVLSCWDAEKLVQLRSHTNTCLPALPDYVSQIIVIDAMEIIACACMDGKIYMVDLHSNKIHRELVGHRNGVTLLKYSATYRYIISGGIDHTIRIWNPFVKSNVIVLKGHRAQLVDIEIITDTPELVTADESGIVKIWDIRTFSCIHTISHDMYCNLLNRQTVSGKLVSCMTYISSKNTVALGHVDISYLQATEVEEFGNSNAILSVLFYKSSGLIFTATAQSAQLWDAKTGVSLKTYSISDESDVSAMSSLGSESFVTGSESGVVSCYQLSTGKRYANNKLHFAEVSSVSHELQDLVVSTSWDGDIAISFSDDLTLCRRINHWNAINQDRSVCEVQKSFITQTEKEEEELPVFTIPIEIRADFGKAAIDRFTKLFVQFKADAPLGCIPVAAYSDVVVELLGPAANSSTTNRLSQEQKSVNKLFDATLTFAEFLKLISPTWKGCGLLDVQVTCQATSLQNSIILTGGSDGSIGVIDALSTMSITKCLGKHVHSISALCVLDRMSFFVAADEGGNLILWTTRPNRFAYEAVYKFQNNNGSSNNSTTSTTVTCMRWVEFTGDVVLSAVKRRRHYLLTGDDAGYIKVWDLNGIIRRIGILERSLKGRTDMTGVKVIPNYETDVVLTHSWKAHDDCVCSLEVAAGLDHSNSAVLMSASSDGTVKAWSMSAKQIGLLSPKDTTALPEWEFPLADIPGLSVEEGEAMRQAVETVAEDRRRAAADRRRSTAISAIRKPSAAPRRRSSLLRMRRGSKKPESSGTTTNTNTTKHDDVQNNNSTKFDPIGTPKLNPSTKKIAERLYGTLLQ